MDLVNDEDNEEHKMSKGWGGTEPPPKDEEEQCRSGNHHPVTDCKAFVCWPGIGGRL